MGKVGFSEARCTYGQPRNFNLETVCLNSAPTEQQPAGRSEDRRPKRRPEGRFIRRWLNRPAGDGAALFVAAPVRAVVVLERDPHITCRANYFECWDSNWSR